MAKSPPIKIYRNNEYVACCKYFEDAAAIAGMTKGTEVRYGHKNVIFVEGNESVWASDSWDGAAEIMMERARKLINK